jgi:hypothetical protein
MCLRAAVPVLAVETSSATMTFTSIGHRYQSGPNKGQCEHNSSGPLAMLGSVVGHGTVHFAP